MIFWKLILSGWGLKKQTGQLFLSRPVYFNKINLKRNKLKT